MVTEVRFRRDLSRALDVMNLVGLLCFSLFSK